MPSLIATIALSAFLLLPTSISQTVPVGPVACQLVTQAQVEQALGVAVGAGAAISAPTSCQWAGPGKIATLTITQTKAGKTPLDQFNAGKASTMPGVTIEPVTGVGDDAYYVFFSGTTRAVGLVVKKGTQSFEIRIYGFDLAQAKPVAKTIATAVAGKL